jgi:hypothetical protein
MEDILKNELFIEHLAKLLSTIETSPENPQSPNQPSQNKENQNLLKSQLQSLETEENEPQSSIFNPKVCENFEKMSYQIKHAFEVSEDICEEKENTEQSLQTRRSNGIYSSNTSNLRMVTNKKSIKDRKQQFINAVIEKFNLNMKKKKQKSKNKNKHAKEPKINILEKSLLTRIGLGLSDMEYFYIENDLRIMSAQKKIHLRFLGKIFGRKSDYYVIFGGKGVGLNGGKIMEPSLKDQKQQKEPEGVGVNKFEIWVARHNRMVGSNFFYFFFNF